MASLHFLDWVIIITYFLFILWVGFFKFKKELKTENEFILSGRKLSLIGFIAIAYVIFKLAPVVLEVGFKFAVICLGLGAFLIIAAIFTSQITVWLS